MHQWAEKGKGLIENRNEKRENALICFTISYQEYGQSFGFVPMFWVGGTSSKSSNLQLRRIESQWSRERERGVGEGGTG